MSLPNKEALSPHEGDWETKELSLEQLKELAALLDNKSSATTTFRTDAAFIGARGQADLGRRPESEGLVILHQTVLPPTRPPLLAMLASLQEVRTSLMFMSFAQHRLGDTPVGSWKSLMVVDAQELPSAIEALTHPALEGLQGRSRAEQERRAAGIGYVMITRDILTTVDIGYLDPFNGTGIEPTPISFPPTEVTTISNTGGFL